MPRATGAPGRELDAAHVGARPLRKRQTSWKQPLAEAATRCEPLKSVAARLARLGGDRNALWLTVTEGPERTPLDDLEFRINARIWLGLSMVRGGQCQHQKRQKSDGTAGAKSLAHLDDHGQHAQKCLCGGDRAKLHDADCHTIHNACCEAGPTSKREVSVPTLATEKLTEPRVEVDAPHHPQRLLRSRAQITTRSDCPDIGTEKLTEPRVDVDAWGPSHIRLDFTVVDEEALHYSSAMRKGQEEAPAAAQAERAKTNKYGKAKGGVGVTGISLQLSGRFGPRLDALLRKLAGYKRAVSKAAGKDGGRPLQEWQKLLSMALARCTATTVLSATAHKALRGT